LLFIGNSHSSVNGLPELVATLIQHGLPEKTVNTALASGYAFLDERLRDGVTNNLLVSRKWTHVSLQAQKYSSSGLYSYSTLEAEEWVRRVKSQDATAVMFPEWPRRGNTEEGHRIHDLHLYIASHDSACVAPIGLAWEESILRKPSLALHASDGNHSNLAGALLTAYVFYEVFTNQLALELPFISEININQDTQKHLREVASFVVLNNMPCP
jgi:hypothetical protein